MFLGERLVHVYDRGSIFLSMVLFIKGNLKEENIRNALDKLQQKHPQLRQHVDGDSFVINEKVNPIPLRIVERETKNTWSEEREKEFALPFDFQTAPLIRFVWVRSEELSEILISAPHTILDGKSFFSLMGEFCLLVDDPGKELKEYTPFASLKDMLPTTSLSWYDKLFARALVYPAKLLLYLATLGKKEQPVEHNSMFWQLNAGQAEALKAAAAEHSVQPGALVTVLMAKSFMKYHNTHKKKRLIFMSLDMRRYIKTIKKDMLFSYAPMLKLNVDFGKETDVWKLAKNLGENIVHQALTKSTIKRTFVQYPMKEGTLFIEYLHGILKLLIKRNLRIDSGQDFNFINTGVVKFPTPNNSFKVEDLHGESRMPWKNPNIFYMMDVNGRLNFFLITNNHLIRKEEVLRIRADFEESISKLLSGNPVNL